MSKDHLAHHSEIIAAANYLVPLLNSDFNVEEAADNLRSAIATAFVYSRLNRSLTKDDGTAIRKELGRLLKS